MFDKFEVRRKSNHKSAYAWWDWNHNHYTRYKRFIDAMPIPLVCQECGGAGGKIEPVPGFYGQGPRFPCGCCEGTGYVTPWLRGQWLRMKRESKKDS